MLDKSPENFDSDTATHFTVVNNPFFAETGAPSCADLHSLLNFG